MKGPESWDCVGATPSIICKHSAVQLDPGQQVVMRVEVLVSIIGRETPVEVGYDQVKKV